MDVLTIEGVFADAHGLVLGFQAVADDDGVLVALGLKKEKNRHG